MKIRLIWSTPWSVPKVLYLISRYSPFVDTILDLYGMYLQRFCQSNVLTVRPPTDYLAPRPSPEVRDYATFTFYTLMFLNDRPRSAMSHTAYRVVTSFYISSLMLPPI